MKPVDIKDYAIYMGLSMLQKGLSVSPLKLQKILYYQQSWHLVYFGRENTLFDCAPHAWVNGPVYPEIYHLYKNKTSNMCDHLKKSDFVDDDIEFNVALRNYSEKLNLTDDEIELTDRVVMLYGSKTQNQLVFMTHSEQPWAEQRIGLKPYTYSDNEMSLDTMYSFFKERYDNNRKK